MGTIGLMTRIAIVGVLAGSLGLAAGVAASGSVAAAHSSGACATVKVVATPKLNTQAGSTETIQNQVKSCAHALETVQIRQSLSLPGAFNGTFQLAAGRTVVITQQIPYVCCGTYYVTVRVFSTTGQRLDSAQTSWTFA